MDRHDVFTRTDLCGKRSDGVAQAAAQVGMVEREHGGRVARIEGGALGMVARGTLAGVRGGAAYRVQPAWLKPDDGRDGALREGERAPRGGIQPGGSEAGVRIIQRLA